MDVHKLIQNPQFDKVLKACPLCNSQNISFYKRDFKGIRIDRCGNCRLQFMNPQYTDEHLAAYYSQYTDLDENRGNDVGWREALLAGHNFYLSLIEKYGTKGSLLSIGCGDGIELEAALDRGWKAEGFDVDPETTQDLAQRLGITVQHGKFEEIEYPEAKFDAVYMHHVLEHPKNPADYLRKIHHILKPNGILFIDSPNIRSFSSSLKHYSEVLGLRKKNVGKYYDTNHHLFYYTPSMLRNIIEKHYRFKILHLRNGHHVRPGQSESKRYWMRNFWELYPYKSTFVFICQKK